MPNKKRRKKRRGRLLPALLCAAFLLLLSPGGRRLMLPQRQIGHAVSSSRPRAEAMSTHSQEGVYSYAACLVRRRDGAVLFEQMADEELAPASLTKIMTVLLGAERLDPMQEVTVPEDLSFLYAENASMAGFLPGEQVRAQDLFYGALLPSGAEACLGIARAVSGSEEGFTQLMNRRAAELGMENTHFENCHGLDAPGHASTARDLALLLNVALEDPVFRRVFTSAGYHLPASSAHPDGLALSSTLFARMGGLTFSGGEILGGKTGYTDQAGLCLASLARKNGEEYLLVTLGAPGTGSDEPLHIYDALYLYQKEAC